MLSRKAAAPSALRREDTVGPAPRRDPSPPPLHRACLPSTPAIIVTGVSPAGSAPRPLNPKPAIKEGILQPHPPPPATASNPRSDTPAASTTKSRDLPPWGGVGEVMAPARRTASSVAPSRGMALLPLRSRSAARAVLQKGVTKVQRGYSLHAPRARLLQNRANLSCQNNPKP